MVEFTAELILTIIGYAFAIFLWKTGFKSYALFYSLIWTNALQWIFPAQYHGIIWFMIWMNAGLLLFHYKLLSKRIKAIFYGRS